MPAGRPLLHLPVFAAACTGLYAGSLALVAMLQSQQNAAAAMDVAPLADALARTSAVRQAAEDAVRYATGALGTASDSYAGATALSAEVDAAIAAFAKQVAQVTGTAARLPAAGRLPAAPGAVKPVAAPVVQATTGASGKP
jgi:hypothetical protein